MKPECSFASSDNDIHIWIVCTRASEVVAAGFEPVLTVDERLRAASFRFDHLRHSFLVTRGILRCLLGRYLDLPPASVRLNYGPKGKPVIASAAEIQFNTTHSGDLAIFAFTRACPIGVDVEQIRPMAGMEDIANRFFCGEEAAEIAALPPGERTQGFFRCWTRKEAYIKAVGDGLSLALNAFRVTVSARQPARLLNVAHDVEAAREWTLQDLFLPSDYIAALAYRDAPRQTSIFPFVAPEEFISAA
jgi:4'-phosphopantetheinyl transferase